MSLLSDWADDIPVKISEKYKPPPRIEIGRSVSESEARARHSLDVLKYDFGFEERVLCKVSELRSTKETLRNERRHRLRLLDEAKQRRIDEIAAAEEAAERIQQLSVAHVSYPSTDDIVPLNCEQPDVLRPVRLYQPSRTHPLDTDPLDDVRRTVPPPPVVPRRNFTHLTVSDFDHDTSSPFDELELQSIDDLEQLAQVLKNGECAQTPTPQQPSNVSYDIPLAPSGYSYYTCPVQSYNFMSQVISTNSHSQNVTDILSELSEEVNLQRRRAEEASALAAAAAPPLSPVASPAVKLPNQTVKCESLPDPYEELPPQLQQLCRRVQGMGFPKGRVARVVSVLGDSDKKVVEGLLLVAQLLDLGFPEKKVADALAKHNFDRDKALDELIT